MLGSLRSAMSWILLDPFRNFESPNNGSSHNEDDREKGIKYQENLPGPGGETGRRKGLKIPRRELHAGSSPAPGTT